MLRLRKKHQRVYRLAIHICICTSLISSFHFIKQYDFLEKTVVAEEKQSNSFLKKDVLPLSSQASLFNPEGLYYQTLAHLDDELYQDFRSHPGIGMNYWNSLSDTRQEIMDKASKLNPKDTASLKELEPLLNDLLLLIEIGEDKYEKILIEELQHPSTEADGMNWASDHTYIKDFLDLQRIWLYHVQKLLKNEYMEVDEINENPERKMYFDSKKNNEILLNIVIDFFFKKNPELN